MEIMVTTLDFANHAIELIKNGIKHNNKKKILEAYNIVEGIDFDWDNIIDKSVFEKWNELVDKGNDILYS